MIEQESSKQTVSPIVNHTTGNSEVAHWHDHTRTERYQGEQSQEACPASQVYGNT